MRYFVAIFALAFALPAMSATYYIDYVSGSDSSAGTSTTAPWKRSPGMSGFSGSYSHASGDQFIFKGGVTWPAACLPLNVTSGGASSKYDYYGVSPSFYSGSAWSRPIFDGQYTAWALVTLQHTANNVMLDNFDIRGEMAQGNFGQGSVDLAGCINVTLTNCWIHKWSHTSAVTTDGQYGGFFNNPMGNGASLTNVLITHCDIGNPDGDGNSGTCMYYPGEVAFCKIHDCPEGLLHGGYSVHDNEFYNIVNSYDGSQHPNMAYLDAWNGAYAVTGPCYFYNNYVHNLSAGEVIYPVSTVPVSGAYPYADWYIYNNVVINNYYETVEIDPYGTAPMRLYINNNTFDNNAGVHINVVPRASQPNTISYYNNMLIGGTPTSVGGTANVIQGNNVIASESAANAAGFVPAKFYYPPSANGLSIAAGANLASLGWPGLMADTSRGNNEAPYARPSSGAWTIGAYQFNNGTQVISNMPPVVSAITQNAADIDPNTPGLQVLTGTTVQYAGSATDPNGDAITWQWSYTVNGGSSVVFQSGSGAVPAINYTYPASSAGQTYVWTLSASDSKLSAQSQLTVSAEVPVVAAGLTFAATSGIITSPFVSAGGYISQPAQTGVTTGGTATYTFAITNAGDYVIQGLVNAPNDSENSFYVNIDGQPTDPTSIWQVPITAGFQNLVVSWQGTGTFDNPQFVPKVFTLSAGTHQLIIVGREMGTQLQSISILQRLAAPQDLRTLQNIVATAPSFPVGL